MTSDMGMSRASCSSPQQSVTIGGAQKHTLISSPPSPPPPSPQKKTLYESWLESQQDETTIWQQLRRVPWKAYLILGCRWCIASPFNFFVAFCCINVVVWGAFLVLELGGAIPMPSHESQLLWIEISSQVLNGFFTLANIPVLPKRAYGLWRNLKIWNLEKRIEKEFLTEFLELDFEGQEQEKAARREELLASLRFYQQFSTCSVEEDLAVADVVVVVEVQEKEKESCGGMVDREPISIQQQQGVIEEISAAVSASNSGTTLSSTRTIPLPVFPSPSSSSNKKVKPPKTIFIPAPLTDIQLCWVKDREAELVKRQEELKKSWTWYDYTMPRNAQPADFLVPCSPTPTASPTTSATTTVTTLPKVGAALAMSATTAYQDSELGLLSARKQHQHPHQQQGIQVATTTSALVEIMDPAQYLVSTAKFFWIMFSFVLNSLIQIVLCGFMWGMNYHVRPSWITGTGVCLGCLAAVVPSLMVAAHQSRFGKVLAAIASDEKMKDEKDGEDQV